LARGGVLSPVRETSGTLGVPNHHRSADKERGMMIIVTCAIGGPILLVLVMIHHELKRMNDRAEGHS